MSRILVAASPPAQQICRPLFAGHILTFADRLENVMKLLDRSTFDMIACTMAFDESRMLELLRRVKAEAKHSDIPFVCMKVQSQSTFSQPFLQDLQIASAALGAVAFLNIDDYNDPTALQSDIERFLSPSTN